MNNIPDLILFLPGSDWREHEYYQLGIFLYFLYGSNWNKINKTKGDIAYGTVTLVKHLAKLKINRPRTRKIRTTKNIHSCTVSGHFWMCFSQWLFLDIYLCKL